MQLEIDNSAADDLDFLHNVHPLVFYLAGHRQLSKAQVQSILKM